MVANWRLLVAGVIIVTAIAGVVVGLGVAPSLGPAASLKTSMAETETSVHVQSGSVTATYQSQTSTSTLQTGTGFTLVGAAFMNGERIPSQYTCDGSGISPPLAWSSAPTQTKTYALIMVDESVGFTHWIIFNIPASQAALEASIPVSGTLPSGATQGVNSFGRNGYGGPCPPSGTHKYVFYLYALDTPLNLGPSATRASVLAAMSGNILAQTQFTGLYR